MDANPGLWATTRLIIMTPDLLHELISGSARRAANRDALRHKGQSLSYSGLLDAVEQASCGLVHLGLRSGDRVAVYLPKLPQTVISIFASSMAGGVIVPVNPLLKAEQVGHILRDSGARILVTSSDRYQLLGAELENCKDLTTVVLTNESIPDNIKCSTHSLVDWRSLARAKACERHRVIDSDVAAILYTSGSTGKPKGVVLSHRNMVAGAKSVAEYLENTGEDRILAVLPFSFDYGFSQLTTAFLTGACVVLMDYLLPRDVIRAVTKEKITGLAAVPPLWTQLANLEWPEDANQTLRYMTNSGGAMPQETLSRLRNAVPSSRFYLMYGLTEAFRSTYLPPDQIDKRPDSMGKAIPNAEILIVKDNGELCCPGETGELVHRGVHVALGYWNDRERTAERFRPLPGQNQALPQAEITVWSGDRVRIDEEGYLYFVGRKDDMIKTSGYRVSPTEIEEIMYANEAIEHAAALGVPHPLLGQAIVVAVTPRKGLTVDIDALTNDCKQHLPSFMVPLEINVFDKLPKNPNGKIDRKQLASQFQHLFENHSL